MKKEGSFGEKLAGLALAAAVSFNPNVPNRNPEQLFEQRDNSPNVPGIVAPIKENVVFAANTETAPPTESPSPSPIPTQSPIPIESPMPTKTPKPVVKAAASSDWTLDPEISFYGPGFYGRRTACGLALTKDLEGVANRTLPCGTLVTFNWKGMTRTFPVVDRGPYVAGRIFDLTGGACMSFKTPQYPRGHCFTGPINYRIGK